MSKLKKSAYYHDFYSIISVQNEIETQISTSTNEGGVRNKKYPLFGGFRGSGEVEQNWENCPKCKKKFLFRYIYLESYSITSY